MKKIQDYEQKGRKAWTVLGPCSKFAQDTWEAATGEYLNANSWLINCPKKLKDSIIKANGGETNGIVDKNIETSISSDSSGKISAGSRAVSNSSVQRVYDNSL